MDRRELLKSFAAIVAGFSVAAEAGRAAAAPGATDTLDPISRMSLEAFADTIIPGAKRYSGDAAVAGAASGPGAAHAGVASLLALPEVGFWPALPGLVIALNAQATSYALRHFILLPIGVPPFVGLNYSARSAVVSELLQPAGLARMPWVLLALMAGIAFDTAGHLHTAAAIRGGHPGLAFVRFPPPGPDGLWRFTDYSYRRQLAQSHPRTTPTGSPA